jgi:hypothetical protein
MRIRLLAIGLGGSCLVATALLASTPTVASQGSRTASASVSNPPRSCRAKHTRTLAVTPAARVFARAYWDPGIGLSPDVGYDVFACRFRARQRERPMRVGFRGPGSELGQISIAQRYVAFFEGVGGKDGSFCQGHAKVIDLFARKTRALGPSIEGVWAVNDLVLTSGGAVAYIVARPYRCSPGDGPVTDYVLMKLDAEGSGTLDEGSGIDPTSLAVAGSRIYWTTDGSPRSATLK